MVGPARPQEAQNDAANGQTLATTVYQLLLGDIQTGVLAPGRRLRMHSLANHYEVGTGPLREALNRLSINGMVVREDNRGYHVSPTSIGELQELIRTRRWLEEIALRKSIENGDAQWEENIVLAFHRLSRQERFEVMGNEYCTAAWEELHQQFHQALIAACHSRFLLGYCGQLHAQTLRYRNLVEVLEYRDSHEGAEHQAIQDAVLDRDADRSVELLQAHFNVTAEVIIRRSELQ